jgi:signal peptidase II
MQIGVAVIYLFIVVGIFVGEVVLKNYIEKHKKLGSSEKILKDKIIVTKYHNQGAFLNLLEKKRELLLFVSGFFIGLMAMFLFLLLPQQGKKLLKLGGAFMLGGAASNVYDRVKRGFVVDYFSFSFYKKVVFNISDIFIFLGSIIVACRLALQQDE